MSEAEKQKNKLFLALDQIDDLDELIKSVEFFKGFSQALVYANIITSAECDLDWLHANSKLEEVKKTQAS